MKFMIMLHVLGIVIWVGGMFFAHQILRPVAADLLEPPLRLPLWVGVFKRFFPWVWVCVAAGSGFRPFHDRASGRHGQGAVVCPCHAGLRALS